MALLALLLGLSTAPAAPVPEEQPKVTAVLRAKIPGPRKPRDLRNFVYSHTKGLRVGGPVFPKVLARPEVAALAVVRGQDDPVKWLKDNLVVEADPDGGTIRVGLRGGLRAEQVVLVNAVVDAYLDYSFSNYDISLRESLAGMESNRELLKNHRDALHGLLKGGRLPNPKQIEEEIRNLDLSIKRKEEEIARWRRRIEEQSRLVLVRKAGASR